MITSLKCEEAQRLTVNLPVPIHQCCRVLPKEHPPAKAWLEDEFDRDRENCCPGEENTLLSKSSFASTTGSHNRSDDCSHSFSNKPKTKSKLKNIKDKLAVIKLPYFIMSMILVLISVHVLVPPQFKSRLEWSPIAWWREPWRLITYGCTHASAAHLTLNSVVALAVAWRLEIEQQRYRVVCVWIGGLVAGALGAGVLQPHVRVVGASAAVYALLTAHLPNVCLRYGNIPLWWFRPLSVLVLVASEACWALFGAPALTTAMAPHRQHYDHVAWSAHILGAAVGIPLAFLFFQGDETNLKKPYIRVCRIISVILLVSGVIFTIIYYGSS